MRSYIVSLILASVFTCDSVSAYVIVCVVLCVCMCVHVWYCVCTYAMHHVCMYCVPMHCARCPCPVLALGRCGLGVWVGTGWYWYIYYTYAYYTRGIQDAAQAVVYGACKVIQIRRGLLYRAARQLKMNALKEV